MADKPWRCRVGLHAYVREHPPGERLGGAVGEVCRLCGKRRGAPDIPLPLLGG
jgi:hypothetical protein